MKLVITGKDEKRIKDIIELLSEGLNKEKKFDFATFREDGETVLVIEPSRPSFVHMHLDTNKPKSILNLFDGIPIKTSNLISIINKNRYRWLR